MLLRDFDQLRLIFKQLEKDLKYTTKKEDRKDLKIFYLNLLFQIFSLTDLRVS